LCGFLGLEAVPGSKQHRHGPLVNTGVLALLCLGQDGDDDDEEYEEEY
jgi:hypothetical protein